MKHSIATLLCIPLLLAGCLEPSRPSGYVPNPPDEWRMGVNDQTRYELAHSTKGKFLSVLYSRRMPYPLGKTFVNDLAIIVQDPQVRTYELPHEDVVVTLARATEVATVDNALIHAVDGTVEIQSATEGGFRGLVQATFRDDATGAEGDYLVIVRFAPPGS